MNELTTQERAVRIARVKMRGEQLATMETQYVLVAAKTGEDLLWLKANCEHGEFKSEFAKEFPELNYPRATQWMKIAKEFPELLDDSKVAPVQLLEYTKIIEIMSAPQEVKTEVFERIENGEDISKREIQRLKKEAADLAIEKQSILENLAGANREIEEKQKLLSWLEADKKAITEQNDQLRNDLAFKVDEKVQQRLNVELEKLISDNNKAIEQAQQNAQAAQNELERLKRAQEKAIKDGVSLELNKLETEMNKKRYQIECYERDLNDLKQVKSELDVEVGTIAIYKTAVKEMKNHLSFFTTSFADVFDTNAIPNEFFTELQSISYAVSQINKQMLDFIREKSPLESTALVGELVN